MTQKLKLRPAILPALTSVFWTLACGLGGEDLQSAQADAAAARADADALRAQVGELSQEIKDLKAENERLGATAQSFFTAGTTALAAGELIAASTAFQAVITQFPVDPLVPQAQAQLREVTDRQLSRYVDVELGPTLSLTDQTTYSSAVERLATLLAACDSCPSGARARSRQAELSAVLASWPEEMQNVGALKVRYGDLRGHNVRFGAGTVTADTYYNCGGKEP